MISKFYLEESQENEKIDKMQVRELKPFLLWENGQVSMTLEKKDQFY